jgi:hypothetical protein
MRSAAPTGPGLRPAPGREPPQPLDVGKEDIVDFFQTSDRFASDRFYGVIRAWTLKTYARSAASINWGWINFLNENNGAI